jgi:hypothetical protein
MTATVFGSEREVDGTPVNASLGMRSRDQSTEPKDFATC